MTTIDFNVGDEVTYIPKHAKNNESHPDRELGKVTSINDEFVFVRYGNKTGSQATSRNDLMKGDHTFYCPDEYNSVMDGAFGRCSHICNNCHKIRSFRSKITEKL